MATLASIQENRDSLPPTDDDPSQRLETTSFSFHRHRPRSHLAFAARRRSQVRITSRRSSKQRRLNLSSHIVGPTPSKSEDKCSFPSPTTAGEKPGPGDATTPTNPKAQAKVTAEPDELPSQISTDLDLFPLPPCNNHAHQNQRDADTANPTENHEASSQVETCTVKHPQDATSQDKQLHACEPVSSKGENRLEPVTALQLGDAAAESPSSPKKGSVDTALIEAISRNIALQLRLASLPEPALTGSEMPSQLLKDDLHAPSRTHSERRALDRFTRELEKYSDHTRAVGKVLDFTSTDRMSPATLRTVSALMPFRPEFTAAGLAVTSRDQAQRLPPHYVRRPPPSRTLDREFPSISREPFPFPQIDGHGRRYTSHGAGMVESHPHTDGINDWEYDMPRQATLQRLPKGGPPRNHRRSRCLPCFPADTDPSTDGGSSQRRPVARNQGSMAAITSRMLSQPAPDAAGHTAATLSSKPIDLIVPHGGQGPRNTLRRQTAPDRFRHAYPKDSKAATGRRRPSQVLSPPSIPPDFGRNTLFRDGPYGVVASRRSPKSTRPQRPANRPLSSHDITDQAPKRPTDEPRQKPSLSPAGQDPLKANPAAIANEHTLLGMPLSPNDTPEIRGQKKAGDEDKEPGGIAVGADAEHAGIRSSRPASPLCPRTGNRPVANGEFPDTQTLLRGRPAVPARSSSILGSLRSTHLANRDRYIEREFSDRDVLRGLNVVASAACDEIVDNYVHHKTGLRIRRFLADLVVLEKLCDVQPDEDNEQRARRRRADLKKLKQHVRRTREFQKLSLPVT